jgi:hypothetical protein
MALRHADEHYTKWTHVENGKVLTRRLHRLEIQARDGRTYVIRGEKLPDFNTPPNRRLHINDRQSSSCGHKLKRIMANLERPAFVERLWRDLGVLLLI